MTLTFMQEFGIEKRKRNVVDFSDMEHYDFKIGNALEGFMLDWIGEFYSYK